MDLLKLVLTCEFTLVYALVCSRAVRGGVLRSGR
jgi:hypothetical protein